MLKSLEGRKWSYVHDNIFENNDLIRLDKSDSTQMTRTEILPELTSEIIDLKFTWTENDPYRTKLDPNIFYLNYFSFQEKLIGPKIS